MSGPYEKVKLEPLSFKPCSSSKTSNRLSSSRVEMEIQCIYSMFSKDFSTHQVFNTILGAGDIIVNKTDKNNLVEFTLLKIKPHQK